LREAHRKNLVQFEVSKAEGGPYSRKKPKRKQYISKVREKIKGGKTWKAVRGSAYKNRRQNVGKKRGSFRRNNWLTESQAQREKIAEKNAWRRGEGERILSNTADEDYPEKKI